MSRIFFLPTCVLTYTMLRDMKPKLLITRMAYMKSSQWITLGLCGALLGCGARNEKTPPNTTTKASEAPPKKEEKRTDYLVVSQKNGEITSQRTVWLKSLKDGYEEIGAHDGVAASDGEELWFWSDKPVPARSADCLCIVDVIERSGSEAEKKGCIHDQIFPGAALYDVHQRERPFRSSVAIPASEPSLDEAMELGSSIAFQASMGPYLFYTESSSITPCGAPHGFDDTSYKVIDLRTGDNKLPWNDAEKSSYTQPHAPEAEKVLCTEDFIGDSVDACGAAHKEPLAAKVTAVFPAFQSSEMKTTVQYTIATFYVATDGLSASYTRSARVPIDAPPSFWKEFAEVPATVKFYWAKNPPGEGSGWSAITGDAAALDAMKDDFVKAPSMNLKIKSP